MSRGKVVGWAILGVWTVIGGPARPGRCDDPSTGSAPISLITVDTPVVLRSRESVLKVEKKVVATGEVHRVYRVERISGDWLWIAADGLGGWVRVSEVLPLDQAVAYYTDELRKQPRNPWLYLMRGMIWYDRRDYDKAIADYSEAIRHDPQSPVGFHDRGDARLARKEFDPAVADYNEALRLDPTSAASYANRALVRAAQHEYVLAIADSNEAIRLDPKDVSKYLHRASSWLALHEYEHALADYRAAIELNPNDATAFNGQAWVWATAADRRFRDGRKAVESATRACELTRWADPFCIGTLAAAEAEQGHFEAAVKWQTKAVELFSKNTQDDESHHRRLALYQAGKPYRDDSGNPRR